MAPKVSQLSLQNHNFCVPVMVKKSINFTHFYWAAFSITVINILIDKIAPIMLIESDYSFDQSALAVRIRMPVL